MAHGFIYPFKEKDKTIEKILTTTEIDGMECIYTLFSEEERKKAEQTRKKEIGFIENKRNKDYNIVYRDRPTKPLTVSELLGIGKKKDDDLTFAALQQ